MTPIQEAIEYIESRESGDEFSYRQIAKRFGVDRTTLSRRHKGVQASGPPMKPKYKLSNYLTYNERMN